MDQYHHVGAGGVPGRGGLRSRPGRRRGRHRSVVVGVPSVVTRIPEGAAMGAGGVPIGSHDLTQPMVRDPPMCAELFNESDDGVLDAIAAIIAACREARSRHRCRAGAVQPARAR